MRSHLYQLGWCWCKMLESAGIFSGTLEGDKQMDHDLYPFFWHPYVFMPMILSCNNFFRTVSNASYTHNSLGPSVKVIFSIVEELMTTVHIITAPQKAADDLSDRLVWRPWVSITLLHFLVLRLWARSSLRWMECSLERRSLFLPQSVCHGSNLSAKFGDIKKVIKQELKWQWRAPAE